MKKALVTGSSGLVGRAVSEKLLQAGYIVHGVDNHSREKFFNIEEVKNDINHPNYMHFPIGLDSVHLIPSKYKVIVHCAAQPSHDLANVDPALDFDTNVKGTHEVLELARKNSPGVTFIYLSTTKVYSDEINKKVVEGKTRYTSNYLINETTETTGDHGLFGVHKLASDMIAQEYGRYYDMKTVVLRPGCITGKGHKGVREHGFLSYLAKCIKEGQEYTINGYEGKQVRDQLHVDDLADAIIEIIKKPKTNYFVIGGGLQNSISVLEAISLLEDLLGKKLKYSFAEARRADHKWNVHDNSKFKKAYPNWMIKYTIEDIIKDLL